MFLFSKRRVKFSVWCQCFPSHRICHQPTADSAHNHFPLAFFKMNIPLVTLVNPSQTRNTRSRLVNLKFGEMYYLFSTTINLTGFPYLCFKDWCDFALYFFLRRRQLVHLRNAPQLLKILQHFSQMDFNGKPERTLGLSVECRFESSC